MNHTLVSALTDALLIATPAALAQTASSAGASQEPPAVELSSAADAQAVLEARLLVLKTVMTLTPGQRRIPAFLGLRKSAAGLPQPIAEIWLVEEEN